MSSGCPLCCCACLRLYGGFPNLRLSHIARMRSLDTSSISSLLPTLLVLIFCEPSQHICESKISSAGTLPYLPIVFRTFSVPSSPRTTNKISPVSVMLLVAYNISLSTSVHHVGNPINKLVQSGFNVPPAAVCMFLPPSPCSPAPLEQFRCGVGQSFTTVASPSPLVSLKPRRL